MIAVISVTRSRFGTPNDQQTMAVISVIVYLIYALLSRFGTLNDQQTMAVILVTVLHLRSIV